MKNILIAHRFPIVREGLKKILSYSGSFVVAAEADTFPVLKSEIGKRKFDALVLDLFMTAGSGLEVLKEIKKNYPELPVLVLTSYSEEIMGFRAYKAGASGYITKDCSKETLLVALNSIINGKHFFSKVTENMIFKELNQTDHGNKPIHVSLSDRELHVFMSLAEGKTLTQISKDLFLSIKTVSTYRLRTLKKMKMKTNSQIVQYAIHVGLIRAL